MTASSPSLSDLSVSCVPVLDPDFLPAVLWNRAYREMAAGGRTLDLALVRQDGTAFRWSSPVLPDTPDNAPLTLRYVERVVKFLLWQKGGSRVLISGAPEVVPALAAIYWPGGGREFDWDFIGKKIFGEPLSFTAVEASGLPEECGDAMALGRHLGGCRIGFDLGGSDRKCAALIDGEVVFSEEIVWDPYFQSDPAYHIEGVQDSLQRAAAHLPRVDAIGGSSAGVYVNNEVRAASLFRGVSAADFESRIRGMFVELKDRWDGIPFEVVNDGEVTALAGSMSLDQSSVLGVAMGTSQAAGYVDPNGSIRPWLNELAFAPVDYREDGPRDEWSGDEGCGVQFFSQQGVARLAKVAGFDFGSMPFPEQLVEVQKAMKEGDERARKIYQTIGTCFGYSIAHYADFYEIGSLLILGRVTSGEGGTIIIEEAEKVLATEFPHLSIQLVVPDEKTKRHGQAVAAASLAAVG
ncbi:ROK family protein [Luteolibacter flavescens]|uniref:ROK family protein n=1 Tax=Luteolibacter flavescens TaxID=1859460 RepID=A0ABT3FKG1_9BACT|nr:ROK family protein [Luteolibacter flavescens]MCW1883699.1 ROK family protein [Luteolibacter flavescens]